ncbi:VOC family protein [Streptomyces radicis]|uniref:VOC family protein n=1 Tax=Streptomyces radicis TaxID=1750517 RepID=A0A3A9WQR5_9ACTN|nr:VOC family protein [Streptomyces radicis]RKN10106.1 VOC family protein [Streptomyces radicis]RKN24448.1 VOC family protein [Streptomyces radicis]
MSDFSEGEPCWVDATVLDVADGKRFYGQLFGWDFGEAAPEYGGYAEAMLDGKTVAALAPQMAGQEAPPAWTLYLSSPSVVTTAGRVREHGGTVLMEPMEIGDLGRMALASDPGGVLFGVWEAGRHKGFGERGRPGTFCWAEVATRDPAAADAFFPAVFPFDVERHAGSPGFDFSVWKVGGEPVMGRLAMDGQAEPGMPPHTEVYFAVEDCDTAAAEVRRLGGRVVDGPKDSPYGRLASVADPQGVEFSVIDLTTRKGEPPATE